jgi:hypothetical protein
MERNIARFKTGDTSRPPEELIGREVAMGFADLITSFAQQGCVGEELAANIRITCEGIQEKFGVLEQQEFLRELTRRKLLQPVR